jgi:hypothetical protein
MPNIFPLQFLLATCSGWVNRQQGQAIDEYVEHYDAERAHQGLGNELIAPDSDSTPLNGPVVERERLGGLPRSYRRAA